jgi:hypothetical protein
MKTIRELREETDGQTRLLWRSSVWDGPINGVMLWEGEMCWFDTKEEVTNEIPLTEEEIKEWADYCGIVVDEVDEEDKIEYEWYRIYNVYRVPKDVMESIEYNHNLFREHVGTHQDYDEHGKRPIDYGVDKHHESMGGNRDHGKFYNERGKHKKYELKLKECEVLGEFTL